MEIFRTVSANVLFLNGCNIEALIGDFGGWWWYHQLRIENIEGAGFKEKIMI